MPFDLEDATFSVSILNHIGFVNSEKANHWSVLGPNDLHTHAAIEVGVVRRADPSLRKDVSLGNEVSVHLDKGGALAGAQVTPDQ